MKEKILYIWTTIFFALIVGSYAYCFTVTTNLDDRNRQLYIEKEQIYKRFRSDIGKLGNAVKLHDSEIEAVNNARNQDRKYYDELIKGMVKDYKDGMQEVQRDVKDILKRMPRVDH